MVYIKMLFKELDIPKKKKETENVRADEKYEYLYRLPISIWKSIKIVQIF